MSEQIPYFEIDVEMPEHLDGSVTLPDGDVASIGDSIEHKKFGVGLIYRIATYHDHLGTLLCVEFPNNFHKMLCLDVVKKVHSSEKSPGGGSSCAT
ncbi:MAG: hypothetical protein K2Y32_02580 [Candidatus Obscuribacterales bacterium]|nr:hypothetical protein [Candidatus Obscuribacterales bacterium]